MNQFQFARSLILGGCMTMLLLLFIPVSNGAYTYLVDPKPVAQTPKYLGVDVEAQMHADRSNLWDWLAFSGATMAREFHPDKDLRRVTSTPELLAIRTKAEFETYRARLLADPEKTLPWNHYRFDQEVAWLGVPDDVVRKARESGVQPFIAMGYIPGFFPRPLINDGVTTVSAANDDARIDWGAAASAYEYYLAHIYRYAAHNGATHYLMMNEPFDKPEFLAQVGILARMARLALEDVRPRLTNRTIAQRLWLSGPACHHGWEAIWKQVEPHADSVDFHFYDMAPELLRNTLTRAAIRSRQTGKHFGMSEFNRIGMRMQPEQATFGLRPALELAEMLMTVLSTAPADHPGFEFALLYQFQAPATHRSFKSLVYGDMNTIDWSIEDAALESKPVECYPDFDALQLRHPTPSFHVFRMLARCAPGDDQATPSFQVLGLGESVEGFTPARDALNNQNISLRHDPEKF